MLNLIHSRKTAYLLLVLAVLALEIFLGWRASIMYERILQDQVGDLEVNLIKGLVFFAITVFGFTLATHRHYGAEAIVDHLKKRGQAKNGWWGIGTAMFIVIVHDLSATIYTIFGDGKLPTPPLVAASIGMCALCFVPFLMSRMMRALHEGVSDEREERHQGKLRRIEQKQEIKALKQRQPQPTPVGQAGPARTAATPAPASPLNLPYVPVPAPVTNGQNGGSPNGTGSF